MFAALQFSGINIELQQLLLSINGDGITFVHQPDHAANGRFWSDVADNEAVGTTAKAAICNQRHFVAETFTNGQVQIGAGDYTFYIKNGWLIEDGRITAPIKDANIIGNGPESLSRITMAADDFKLDTGGWTCGKDGQGVPVSQGLPTVLVSAMTVGGAT